MNSLAYPCAPVPEVPKVVTSRLCPHPSSHWAPHPEEKLATLAQMMRQETPIADDKVMLSGYVYLGQFIDHDITRDVRLFDEAGPDVERLSTTALHVWISICCTVKIRRQCLASTNATVGSN